MDMDGLWALFCKTGLPEAYLALAGQRREDEQAREQLAQPAFRPRIQEI